MIYFFYANFIVVLFTTIGSLFVYFKFNSKLLDKIICFSSGIMIASAFFSLLIKSIDLTNNILLVSLFFISGSVIILLFSKIFGKNNSKKMPYIVSMIFHNVPEGIVLGIMFQIAYTSNNLQSFFLFVIGMSIQNIADGLSVSIPLYKMGLSKNKAFIWGFISGVIEPIMSVFSFLILNLSNNFYPFILAFSSGMVLYVIFDLILNEASSDTFYIILGFNLMMILENIF